MTTYYTNPDLITSVITAGGMSDHEIVINIVDMKAKTTKKKPRRVYIYKNGNIENIREDIITFRRELEKDRTKSPDEMYNKFVEVIRTSTEKHIPHKTLSGRWGRTVGKQEHQDTDKEKEEKVRQSQTIRNT